MFASSLILPPLKKISDRKGSHFIFLKLGWTIVYKVHRSESLSSVALSPWAFSLKPLAVGVIHSFIYSFSHIQLLVCARSCFGCCLYTSRENRQKLLPSLSLYVRGDSWQVKPLNSTVREYSSWSACRQGSFDLCIPCSTLAHFEMHNTNLKTKGLVCSGMRGSKEGRALSSRHTHQSTTPRWQWEEVFLPGGVERRQKVINWVVRISGQCPQGLTR